MANTEQFKKVLKLVQQTGRIDQEAFKHLTKEEIELIKELNSSGLLDESFELLDVNGTEDEWTVIKNKINLHVPKAIPLWKTLVPYAAIFVGLVISTLFLLERNETTFETVQPDPEAITLRTGEDAIEVIEEKGNQKIVGANGKVIANQKGNVLSYSADSEIEELVYSEVQIPYGKIFNVLLSDGTLVHLNSGTKFKYPIKFIKGQNREVFIEGEAYFKVAKDTEHPFIVNADEVAVKVLGTEFNLSSYPDEKNITTVLVEGSVNMTNTYTPDQSTILKPGHRARWGKTDHTTLLDEVDTETFTGWITGEVVFRNTPFHIMAKKLERRYNVSIENRNKSLNSKVLNASFNVNVESIDDILQSLNQLQPFTYHISNNKITIK